MEPGSLTGALQEHILDNLQVEHTTASLAARAHMSERNLARTFVKECGVTPIAFLNYARIDAARRYLEATDISLREIAKRCGFGSADALRRVFARRLQINPADYRERFGSDAESLAEQALHMKKPVKRRASKRPASPGAANDAQTSSDVC